MNKIDLSAIKKTNPDQKEKGSSDNSILAALNKDITFFKKKVLNDKKKERFYSDLNLLLESGVDLKTALELFIEEQKNEKEKELYVKISKAIVGGLTLSESLQNENEFSLYEVYSIKIGEESGSLNKVLKDLSVFFTNKITQQRKLVNAFSYPVMVLGVAFCVIAFMLNFVVPMFSDVFKRLNGELPGITVFVINMSAWFSSNFWYFILFIIAIITFVVYNKNKEWYRKFSSQLLLKTPLFGSIYEQIYLARFCSSMSLLLGAKTPLISCLDLVEKMIGFYPIEKSVHELRQEIYKGTSLSTAMKKHKIYNSRMISLIKVGEEVNQLDTIFTKLSAQLTTEAEQKTSLLSSLIEPIMIIFIGVFVAVILISMYLPLFKISTTVF